MCELGRVLCVLVSAVAVAACGDRSPSSTTGGATDAPGLAELASAGDGSAAALAYRNAVNTPPPGWKGHVFQLSHAYPTELPAPPPGGFPWQAHEFESDPEGYMQAVLDYARADLEALDWDPTRMAVPTWFHTPWMSTGPASGPGREFIRGLTKERPSRSGELSKTQTTNFIPNYAVGLYNDRGAYTFGRVWADPAAPDLGGDTPHFAEGSMAIKLLFTAADPGVPADGVPFLKGSLEWQANVAPYKSDDRQPVTLRLLQVDIAVRDARNDGVTGWLFGTFAYDGDRPGATPFERLAPVGLMWGDSPGFTPADLAAGGTPPEQWINRQVGTYQHLGWADRINGPVDNPASSCLSCHGGGAETPLKTSIVPDPRLHLSDQQKLAWFENIRAGQARDAGSISLDYSLQLGVGLRNWKTYANSSGGTLQALAGDALEEPLDRGIEPRDD